MKYDLAEVLRNPLRYRRRTYRHALANPRAVPAKTLGYAKYDFVRVLNQGLDSFGLRGSIVEKVVARTLAVPAARFFRMRRSVSLLVSQEDGDTQIVEGTYQSPILVQWQHAPTQSRDASTSRSPNSDNQSQTTEDTKFTKPHPSCPSCPSLGSVGQRIRWELGVIS